VTKHAFFVAALGLTFLVSASAGFAQETATETEPAEPTAETAEDATEAPADGEEAPAADPAQEPAGTEPVTPQPGDITITEHGDWELRCETPENCFMYQLTRDAELNPVAEVSIVALPDGGQAAAGVTIVTPLGTLLSEGVLLQVDSGRAVKYDFGWCTRAGCFARFGLTAQELDNMRRGNTARIRIVAVSSPERPVLLDVSLTGFTAAFNDMTDG